MNTLSVCVYLCIFLRIYLVFAPFLGPQSKTAIFLKKLVFSTPFLGPQYLKLGPQYFSKVNPFSPSNFFIFLLLPKT